MPAHTTYIESHLGGGSVIRHKKPAAVNIGIDIDVHVIQRWQAESALKCQLVHADASSYLEQYPFIGTELVYSDPPYVKATRRQARVYRHDYEDADHLRLLAVLKALPCMVLLSGYENPMYAKALEGWRKISFSTRTRVDTREECVWFNFEPPRRLHDGEHLGATYRERQSIKRRNQRWLDRLDSMEPAERSHLLSLIRNKYMQEVPQA